MKVATDNFFWGVSTSGYQHEGGYNQDGQPLNNWYFWERSRRVPAAGRATDFWGRYETDMGLASEIGLNAFRLSLEWSRIQPSWTPDPQDEPPFSQDALEHYGRILVSARERGLEPFVTFFHFTHPLWLGLDPWLQPGTPDLFANFVKITLEALNTSLIKAGHPPLKWFITVNEPNMLALNTYQSGSFPSLGKKCLDALLTATHHLLVAHALAYRTIHGLYDEHPEWQTQPMVSFNNYASDLYWMDGFMQDIFAAPSKGVLKENVFCWLQGRCSEFDRRFDKAGLPMDGGGLGWLGRLVKKWHRRVAEQWVIPSRFERLLSLLYSGPSTLMLDYCAVDYYDPFIAHAFRLPRFWEMPWSGSKREWLIQSVTSKWWDWRVLPEGLRFFCRCYQETFGNIPIVIAENGMAVKQLFSHNLPWRRDSMARSDYLKGHVGMVEKMRDEGMPLIGYFHWSLTDNYEWGSFEPRFGLFHVNFHSDNLEREAVDSLGDNPSQTYAELIRQSKNKPTK